MNTVAGEILAILRRYLSEPTSRSLLSSAARRANLRLETMTRVDVPALVRELGPGLNIFLQEHEKLQNCKKLLASVTKESSAPSDSPTPDGNLRHQGEFDPLAQTQSQTDDMSIPIRTEHDVVRARTLGKEMAKQIGFSDVMQTKVATAISEAARNIFQYAGTGEVRIRRIEGKPGGIEIVARDQGPGLSEPTIILSSAYRSKWGVGAGLRGTKRLIDEFELDPHPSKNHRPAWLDKPLVLVPTGARLFLASETFPPKSLWPNLTSADLQWLEGAACGAPGSLVWPGLFPRLHQKLARLLLASAGHYDPHVVLAAARDAYAPDLGAFLPQKPRETRRYHAHDAFACALVHPGISIEERHSLALETIRPSSRGHRSRRKTWASLRFAFSNGFLTADRLPQYVVERLSYADGPNRQ